MGVGSGGTNCEFVLLGRPSLIVLCFAAKNLLPPFPLLYFPSHYFSLLPPLLSSPFIPLHHSLLHSCLIFSPHSPFFPPFFSFSSPSFSPSSPPSLLLFHPPFLPSFLPSSPHLVSPPPNLSPVTIHPMKNRAVRAGQVTMIVRMRRGQGEGSHEKDNKMINYWTTFSKLSFARGEGLVVCGLLWVPTAYVCVSGLIAVH